MTDSHTANAIPARPNQVHEVRIVTGARLHFGLLSTAPPFGGVGVMIDQPSTELMVTEAERFECAQAIESRATPIVERIANSAGLTAMPACRIDLIRQADKHCGLGSGTQLALAISESICKWIGVDPESHQLATRFANRGKRSAVGIHGYFCGGTIFEAGSQDDVVNPILMRAELSSHWRVAVFRPPGTHQPISGDREREHFARLGSPDRSVVARLTTTARQLMQAASRGEFQTFAAAVEQYNRDSGLLFGEIQGGPYNGDAVADLVHKLRQRGAVGIGQSSWGPGVFAWFDSAASVANYTTRLPGDIELVAVAGPRNGPRQITIR